MTTAELNSFLAQTHNAIVGVNRRGKGPQLTPVWYVWDGETFRFSTTRDRVKFAGIKQDPAITLIVDSVPDHTYVVATGRAEIVEDNVAALSRPLIEKYVPAERVEQSMGMVQDPSRVLVVLRPEKMLVNGAAVPAAGEPSGA